MAELRSTPHALFFNRCLESIEDFSKKIQSDTITLLEIQNEKTDGKYLLGHKLAIRSGRYNRNSASTLTPTVRKSIIQLLINNINDRLDYEIEV